MKQRWQNRRHMVRNAVRRLFNLQFAIIYYGFTVVTITIVSEMWDIRIEFYYIINVDEH